MDSLKRLIRNWLGFSRTEINGFLILLPLLVIIIFSEPIHKWWLVGRTENFTVEQRKLDSLVSLWEIRSKLRNRDSSANSQNVAFTLHRFPFDPNKSTINDLQSLGFSRHLSKRIANYRQNGGKFRIKSDVLKIYGMDSSLYRQLYAYILLPEKTVENKKAALSFTEKKKETFVFNINTADTTQLKAIQGIGSVLAARIVNYRSALGGFTRSTQLSEVYGLDSVVVNRLIKASFIDEHFNPIALNLNSADERVLSAHPYIKKKMARAIVAYRFQHGRFKQLEDLRKIAVITPAEVERLIAYVKIID
jgi:competence protein ComEA